MYVCMCACVLYICVYLCFPYSANEDAIVFVFVFFFVFCFFRQGKHFHTLNENETFTFINDSVLLSVCPQLNWNTLKAVLENDGYFFSRRKNKTTCINDDLVQDMTGCIWRDWNHEFDLIKEKLGKFEDGWILEPGVDQALLKLKKINPSFVTSVAFREVSLMCSATVSFRQSGQSGLVPRPVSLGVWVCSARSGSRR